MPEKPANLNDHKKTALRRLLYSLQQNYFFGAAASEAFLAESTAAPAESLATLAASLAAPIAPTAAEAAPVAAEAAPVAEEAAAVAAEAAASAAAGAGTTTTTGATTAGAGAATGASSFLPQAAKATEATRAAKTRDLFISLSLKLKRKQFPEIVKNLTAKSNFLPSDLSVFLDQTKGLELFCPAFDYSPD